MTDSRPGPEPVPDPSAPLDPSAPPEPSAPPDASAPPDPSVRRRRWRLIAVALLFIGLWVVGDATGLVDRLEAEEVRRTVSEAGAWGVLLYVAIFALGELVHVPGMIFVAAGILAWGQLWGFVICLVASIVSVAVSFVVVRTVGGRALAGVDKPFMRKMLTRLHARPILTIIVLRAIFWLSPPLNYALAMTDVRFRDYLVGSALGLVLPIALAAAFFELLFT